MSDSADLGEVPSSMEGETTQKSTTNGHPKVLNLTSEHPVDLPPNKEIIPYDMPDTTVIPAETNDLFAEEAQYTPPANIDFSNKKVHEVLEMDKHEFNKLHDILPKDEEISVEDLLHAADEVDAKPKTSDSVKYFGATAKEGSTSKLEHDAFEYPMTNINRGCFIIFNHMKFEEHVNMSVRKGTHVDAKNLEETARKLGFEYIRTFPDLTIKEIKNWIRAISRADHSDYDCFACAILTHGEEGNILYAKDGQISLDEFTKPFRGDRCYSLAGKPKMFFVQACRGTELDDGVITGLDSVDASGIQLQKVANKIEQPIRIPAEADFLLAYSTASGHYAWRNQTAGSWFIQAVCECLKTYGHYMELMQIMTRVNRMVAYDFESSCKSLPHMHGKKQIPHVVTRLTAEVFFREKKKDKSDDNESNSSNDEQNENVTGMRKASNVSYETNV